MSGIDGATRTRLEDERDELLAAIDGLDRELAAGELDEVDHAELRDDYVRRTAGVLHRIEGRPAPTRVSGGGRRLRAAILGGAAVFAVLAGIALARSSGERGVNDSLTGGVDQSLRERVAECQAQGSSGGDLIGALQCFDEVLTEDPDNAEALTYRGWYLILASGALHAGDGGTAGGAATGDTAGTDTADDGAAVSDEDLAELADIGLGYLDQAIEADPGLPDPLAFRAVVHDRQGDSEAACADVAALLALDPPEFFVTQTSGVVSRNGC